MKVASKASGSKTNPNHPKPIFAFPSSLKANFCPDCGTILDLPHNLSKPVVCTYCNYKCPIEELQSQEIVTQQKSPHLQLKKKKDNKADEHDPSKQAATVEIVCEKCNGKRAEFRTLQLRSADEGQTVFYKCTTCGYAWSETT